MIEAGSCDDGVWILPGVGVSWGVSDPPRGVLEPEPRCEGEGV